MMVHKSNPDRRRFVPKHMQDGSDPAQARDDSPPLMHSLPDVGPWTATHASINRGICLWRVMQTPPLQCCCCGGCGVSDDGESATLLHGSSLDLESRVECGIEI